VLSSQELGAEEEAEMRRHAASVIVKGTKARERLLDEVNLFLHTVDAKLPSGVERSVPRLESDGDALRGKRVLVVDDDVRNVFAILSVLEAQGMLVETATNGKEALAAVERPDAVFDLVLMDMMMPEMDGYEAMQAIRRIERLQKLPVIALTARAMKGEREQCLAAGANDYLSKPLKIDRLLALIKLWIA
jgi:CheY-like chemotaxis protein